MLRINLIVEKKDFLIIKFFRSSIAWFIKLLFEKKCFYFNYLKINPTKKTKFWDDKIIEISFL